jgi:hypothetical protein
VQRSKRLPGGRKIERSRRGVNRSFRICEPGQVSARKRKAGDDIDRGKTPRLVRAEARTYRKRRNWFTSRTAVRAYMGFSVDFDGGSLLKSFKKTRNWKLVAIFM